MTDTTLLPCPFCGGRAIVTNQTAGKRASCLTCRARGPLVPVLSKGPTAYDRAIAAWNRRDQWRPIESAPKTSRAILIYVPENQCTYCVSWIAEDAYGNPGWQIFGGGWRDTIQRPSHWMPLPENPITPPAPVSGGNK